MTQALDLLGQAIERHPHYGLLSVWRRSAKRIFTLLVGPTIKPRTAAKASSLLSERWDRRR
jgi:hypothetical protein